MSDSDDRSSLERPLEALVFAPLGFALEARQMYPRFVDRGRNQILLARLVGRYATRQAMTAAGGVLERNAGPATDVLRLVGLVGDAGGGDAAPVAPTAERDTSAAAPAAAPVDAVPARVAPADVAPGDVDPVDVDPVDVAPVDVAPVDVAPADLGLDEVVDVPDPATLAIPDYDSLAASQVVPRLDALDDAELEDVRCYEAGVRGRKTILAKIAQLQAG